MDSSAFESGERMDLNDPNVRHIVSSSERKRIISTQPSSRPHGLSHIPDDIASNKELAACLSLLPSNYNFEIPKTLWRIRQEKSTCVALQMPEGLHMFACTIADILEKFAGVETVILGDVTYGACCVDDLTAIALGADLLVHYGHSCLVPIDATRIKMLYIFVDIQIDIHHLVETIKFNFDSDTTLFLVGTIQFVTAIHAAQAMLSDTHSVRVPQSRPLSPGEILGCTAPRITQEMIGKGARSAIVYVGDGRFHLEAMMMANSSMDAYKYDPYAKVLTREQFDAPRLHAVRQNAIQKAKTSSCFGLILGTLGRQGSPAVLQQLQQIVKSAGRDHVVVLLSEIFPSKLTRFPSIDAWIQVACPRLSLDWGYAFPSPLLSPFEAHVALANTEYPADAYPMDFYSGGTTGPWGVYYHNPKMRRTPRS